MAQHNGTSDDQSALVSSIITSEQTPTTSTALENTGPQASDATTISLRAQWEAALERWRSSLIVNEFEQDPNRLAVANFTEWKDLFEDLDRRIQEAQQTSYRQLIQQFIPHLEMLDKWFPFLALVIAMPSTSRRNSLVCAVIYLGVKAALVSESVFRSFLDTAKKLQDQLVQFDRHAGILNRLAQDPETNKQIGAALVDMFEAILNFWVAAVLSLQAKWPAAITDMWPEFPRKSEEVISKVTAAAKSVKRLFKERTAISHLAQSQDHSSLLPDNFLRKLSLESDLYEIPLKRETFHGRGTELKMVKDHLCNIIIPGRLASYAIYGLGGVGKTSLALEFAWFCRDNKVFDAIFWIHSETSISIGQSFSAIALRLGIIKPGQGEDYETIFYLVKVWLSSCRRSWLLVFDNVEDVALLTSHLPTCPGHVLVTTRYRSTALKVGGVNKAYELSPLNPVQARLLFDLLRTRYRQADPVSAPSNSEEQGPELERAPSTQDLEEETATTELVDKLGGLPVGIEHMAAYIESEELSVVEFLEMYKAMAKTILMRDSLGINTPHTLFTLWATSFEKIKRTSPDAYQILCIISTLAPDNIPIGMFSNVQQAAASQNDENTAHMVSMSRSRVEKAIVQLKDLALIRRSGKVVSIHRLTQQSFTAHLTPANLQMAFSSAVQLIDLAFPTSEKGRTLLDKWETCQALIQHALVLAQFFDDAIQEAEPDGISTTAELQGLVKNCLWYLYEVGELDSALKLLKQADQMFPDQSTLTYGHICNTACVIYFELNNLTKSEERLRKAFAIQSKLLPNDDTELANTYGNLGAMAATRGRFTEALEHLDMADKARLKAGKEVIIPYAINQSTYGWVLARMSRYDDVEERLERARAIYESHQGMELLVAHLLYEYGNLRFSLKDYPRALSDYDNGLKMASALSPLHILVAAFRYKLGMVEFTLGTCQAARHHFETALKITEQRRLTGASARIMRRISLLVQADSLATPEDKVRAVQLRTQAAKLKSDLEVEHGIDQRQVLDVSEDTQYDNLVSPFYQ